jgi:hypothetical protein
MDWASYNTGQVQLTQGLGQWITRYAANPAFTRYLEIGSWNGRGSTICFGAGFEHRPSAYDFRSMETSPERVAESRSFWAFNPKIQIFHGRILKDEDIPTFDMVHSALGAEIVASWHAEDMSNFRVAAFQDMVEFRPQVALLDGGEYMTYFEYLVLKDMVDVFLLDDTSITKCKRIVQELSADAGWEWVAGSSVERNGWQVFQRVSSATIRATS